MTGVSCHACGWGVTACPRCDADLGDRRGDPEVTSGAPTSDSLRAYLDARRRAQDVLATIGTQNQYRVLARYERLGFQIDPSLEQAARDALVPLTPLLSPEKFVQAFDHMSDAAFLALAWEFGIQPQDFVEKPAPLDVTLPFCAASSDDYSRGFDECRRLDRGVLATLFQPAVFLKTVHAIQTHGLLRFLDLHFPLEDDDYPEPEPGKEGVGEPS